MRRTPLVLGLFAVLVASAAVTAVEAEGYGRQEAFALAHRLRAVFGKGAHRPGTPLTTQLGPRPFYLVDDMDDGPLKDQLLACTENPAEPSDFSIAHRGAPLQLPEHSKEAYLAGARMGAGIMECDVTFTKDKELVCRHSQCDLHTTTNILAIPELAAKCRKPFVPYDETRGTPASAECCTSDLTLAEFKRLCAKMDASVPTAKTVDAYLGGTPGFRTDLYAGGCATVMTHRESIALFDGLGLKFTPEIKEPGVPMPFDGTFTQAAYVQKVVDEYVQAGIVPARVFVQSFQLEDVLYLVQRSPAFGEQAVYLDARVDSAEGYAAAVAGMGNLASQGVKIVAPPSLALLKLDRNQRIVPSDYAIAAKQAGLDIITWSLERSGSLRHGGDYYYQSVKDVIDDDGDVYTIIDVLARQVGVRGIFSDWPATVTFYANCFGL